MSNKLKYLDKKGLAKVFSLIKFGHKKIWHGTLAEWEALSAEEKAEYDQAEVIDDDTGVPVVVDKIESGNMNAVTSNAVSKIGTVYTKTTVQAARAAGSAAEWYDNPSLDVSDLPNGLYICYVVTAAHDVKPGNTDIFSANGTNMYSMSNGFSGIHGSFMFNKTSGITTLANRTYKNETSVVSAGNITWQFIRLSVKD